MGEIRLAIRSLLKSKLFTAVAIFTLVIGIGATTAVFAVFDAVALRPLPFTEQHRLVDIEEWSATELCAECGVGVSRPMLTELEQRMKTVSALIAYTEFPVNVGGRQAPERVSAAAITGNFFNELGLSPAIGRALDLTDDRAGAPRVAVISKRYFQRRFAGDRSAIGQSIRVNGSPTVVVGVMPATAVLPEFAEIWLPLDRATLSTDRRARDIGLIGRLADGASRADADAELKKIAADLEQAFPETQKNWTARARLLRDATGDDNRRPFGLMLGAVLVLWAVVCANLAALLLARGVARRKEIAVRLALGGTRRAIAWHLFAESLCLSIAGGVLGAIAASWAVDVLLGTLGTTIPSWLNPRLDDTVLGFCVLLSLISSAAFGLLPAIRATRPEVHDDLKAGAQSRVGGGNALRGSLVVLQLTLSLMLLAVAGVLSTTIGSMSATDDDRDADIIQARVEMLGDGPADNMATTIAGFTGRIGALAGVRSVAASAAGFIAGFGGDDERIKVEGIPVIPDGVSPRFFFAVTPGFFETSRLTIAEGRAFTNGDSRGANPVAIVNRRLASQLWPGRPAIGRRIKLGADSMRWLTVVGVVADVGDTANGRFKNSAYVPYAQSPLSPVTLIVQAKGDPLAMIKPLREAARAIDADLPLLDVMTTQQANAMRWRPLRAYALTISTIGVIALILAAVGLYGIVAYGAEQRTREIGVRVALGATRAEVIRLVTRQGLRLVALGTVFGVVAAAAVTPLLRGMLFGANPLNVLVFGASAAILVVVAAFASYLPARRAATTDPMVALRSE